MDLVDCFTVQPAPLGAPLGMDWWNSLSGPATEFSAANLVLAGILLTNALGENLPSRH